MVRIYGGCAKRPCAGALITSKHVLTAYHCTFPEGETEPCDHSDGEEDTYSLMLLMKISSTPGKRIAIMGQNEYKHTKARGIKMPITGFRGIGGIESGLIDYWGVQSTLCGSLFLHSLQFIVFFAS